MATSATLSPCFTLRAGSTRLLPHTRPPAASGHGATSTVGRAWPRLRWADLPPERASVSFAGATGSPARRGQPVVGTGPATWEQRPLSESSPQVGGEVYSASLPGTERAMCVRCPLSSHGHELGHSGSRHRAARKPRRADCEQAPVPCPHSV